MQRSNTKLTCALFVSALTIGVSGQVSNRGLASFVRSWSGAWLCAVADVAAAAVA